MNIYERAILIRNHLTDRAHWKIDWENELVVALRADPETYSNISIRRLLAKLIAEYFPNYNSSSFMILEFGWNASYEEHIKLLDLLVKYAKNIAFY